MKYALLIGAAAWIIAAAYRWAKRPPPAPEMPLDLARRIIRQNAARAETTGETEKNIAPPVNLGLFIRD